jgi:hypothetical protein
MCQRNSVSFEQIRPGLHRALEIAEYRLADTPYNFEMKRLIFLNQMRIFSKTVKFSKK